MVAPGRRWFFQIHLWSALTVGLVLLLVSVTGALMVFRPELDPVFNRGLFTVAPAGPPQTLDALVAAARRAHPEARVDFVRLGAAPGRSVQVGFADKQVGFVNPCTAEVLGVRGHYEGFFGRCEQWHRFLLLGAAGKFIARAGATLTVVVLLTGFYLWLPPAWRWWRAGLTLNFSLRGRAWSFNLHKVAGFYAGAVVLGSALTGLSQSFDWLQHGAYQGWGAAPAAAELHSTPAVAAGQPVALQVWLDQARRLAPAARSLMINFPRRPDAPVEIYAAERAAAHENARSYLFLDAYTGAVLRWAPYADSPAGVKLCLLAVSYHFGQFGGWGGRLLLLTGTLAVPLLAFTGLSMFRQRRRQRSA